MFENLQEASFRGVVFEVPDASTQFGRRVETHEYPGRDAPVHEDLGLAVRRFSVSAVVRGADWHGDALKLEAALSEGGPGKLIHPYYGELEVVVLTANRTDSLSSVGEVTFRIDFEKYGPPALPEPVRNTASEVTRGATSLYTAVSADFLERFAAENVPDFITADAAERLQNFTDQARSIFAAASLPTLITWPTGWPQGSASDLAASIVGLYRDIAGLVKRKPAAVIGSQTVPVALSGGQVLGVMRSLAAASGHRVAETGTGTSSAAVRVANSVALDLMQRTAAAAAAAEVSASATYESREQALEMRDTLAGALQVLRDDLGAAGWDGAWGDTNGLTAAVVRDINERIGRLPRTVRIQNTAQRPSMVLAQRLYGDDPARLFDKAGDLTARNRVRHPGFVPAEELEVLL